MADFNPFELGAELVDGAAAQAPALPDAAPAFDPFQNGAEPVEQTDRVSSRGIADLVTGTPPAFDPFQSGAEPAAAADQSFWHQTANAVQKMEGALAKTYASAEAFGRNVWGNLSDQLFGTNIGAPNHPSAPEQELKNYDQQLAAKQQMLAALPPGHPDTERLGNEVAGLQADRNNFIAGRNAKSELFTNAYTDLHNTLAAIDPQFGVDPQLNDTIAAKTGEAIGGLLPAFIPGAGTEVFLITSAVTHWADTYDKTNGDAAAADAAMAKDLGKNVIYIGAAHGANSQLLKALAATPGVSALQSLAVRAAGGAAGNIAIGQGLAGAAAAAEAKPGERMAAFEKAFNTTDGANTAIAAGLGLLGAKPIDSIKAIAREAIANRTRAAQPEIPIAEAAASRARTIAPRTAEALQSVVDESLVKPGPAPAGEVGPEIPIAPGSPESILAPPTPIEAVPQTPPAAPALPENVLTRGTLGETHAQLADRIIKNPEAPAAELDAAIAAGTNDKLHAFVDSEGNVLDRAQAGQLALKAGQIKPEFAHLYADGKGELQSQHLQEATKAGPKIEGPALLKTPIAPQPAPIAPVVAQEPLIAPQPAVPPVIPQRPLAEPAPPPTAREVAAAARLSPEERTAKIETNTAALRESVAKTGIVPPLVEIRGQLANDAKAAGSLHAELTANVASKYPPEPLPGGATESLTKNTLTGDRLPSVNEGGKLRPRFTNDPNLTAQQIDNGSVGTDKANRLYVPDEIVDADQVNPAIETTYDKEAGKFYVSKVNSEFGPIEKPGDFEAPYRADKQLQKAHQLVLGGTPDEVQQIANRVAPEDNPIGQALTENGFKQDAIRYEPDEVDVPEGAVAMRGSGVKPTQEQSRTIIEALKRVKILTPEGVAAPDAVPSMLEAIISKDLPAFPWMRIMAERLVKSGVDLSKVETEVVNRPNADYSGLYKPNAADVTAGTLTFNVGVAHEGGVLGTALHELFHHATLVKAEPGYKRNTAEQAAYDNLQALYDHATREIFKANEGREGTPEELAKFQTDQGTKGPNMNRVYYGLSNFREFISESLANPKFMKALQQIKGLPGIKVRAGIRDLLEAVRDALKTLFTGSTSRNATMDQVLDQSLQFIEAGAVEHARAGEVPYVAAAAKGKPPVVVDGPGWVTPGGEFVPADESAVVAGPNVGEGFGGHEQAALDYLTRTDPAKADALLAAGAGEPLDYGKVTEFMEKNGFVRVTGGGRGGTIYITGKPSRSQLQLLKDNAIEQRASLVHDVGERSRTLFSPDQAFSAPAEEPSPTAPKITTTETGHSVEIPPDATRTELQEAIGSLEDPANGIKPEDKVRIWNELTNALGPTITLQGPAAPGGPPPAAPAAAPGSPAPPAPVLSKRAAADRITYGYDAVNNIANGRGKQIANSVALDFGSSKSPTPEQMLDRQSAPFVVEAGGNKEELVRDLMQVLHSKDAKLAAEYAPIIQHAIDNFTRLDATTQNYRALTKEQLDREHAAGVTTGELENYVTRLLEQPDNQAAVLPASGGQGRSAYFTKGRKFEKLADAIKEGYAPKSTDIVDLTQRRVEAGERLVQQKLLEQELRTLNAPNNLPILGKMDEYQSITGKNELSVPRGYTLVQTGGRPLVVNSDVAPVFKALYGDSTISQALKSTAGFLKQNTLVFDTFHVGRILFKELAYSKGGGRFGYNKGLSLLEYKPEDVHRAVKVGDISQRMADYTNEVLPSGLTRRAATEELLKRGLNVGKVSDNLLAEHSAQLPFIKNFNPWVFQKLSRGAMIQTALENFERNMSRFPERGIEGNARQTAKEYNEVFGNLQNQGLFTNKNYQDLARSLILAPNWAESQLRAELRGYGQIAKTVPDVARGNFRLGTVAQGQLTVILGMLAANQVANYLSTGHSTFENKDGHKLDAFIPGGNRGFWFSPLEIGAEYAHMASRYFSQHQNPIDVITQIASNKLGPVARSADTLISGRDYAGRSFATTKDRIVGALTDLVPLPIGLSGTIERDPRQEAFGEGIPGLPGFRRNRQPGATERQALQSLGLKVTPAMSPTSEVFALAYPFRSDRSYQGPVEYRDLRAALDNKDDSSVHKEIGLLAARGKTVNQIESAIGVGTRQKFTDSTVREVAFVRSLTPDQKKLYEQAQAEHATHAKALMAALRASPAEVKAKLKTNMRPELPSQ